MTMPPTCFRNAGPWFTVSHIRLASRLAKSSDFHELAACLVSFQSFAPEGVAGPIFECSSLNHRMYSAKFFGIRCYQKCIF